ncbi:MAG: hypothetical protein ACHREM_03930 [Polyangiales bacterium]
MSTPKDDDGFIPRYDAPAPDVVLDEKRKPSSEYWDIADYIANDIAIGHATRDRSSFVAVDGSDRVEARRFDRAERGRSGVRLARSMREPYGTPARRALAATRFHAIAPITGGGARRSLIPRVSRRQPEAFTDGGL